MQVQKIDAHIRHSTFILESVDSPNNIKIHWKWLGAILYRLGLAVKIETAKEGECYLRLWGTVSWIKQKELEFISEGERGKGSFAERLIRIQQVIRGRMDPSSIKNFNEVMKQEVFPNRLTIQDSYNFSRVCKAWKVIGDNKKEKLFQDRLSIVLTAIDHLVLLDDLAGSENVKTPEDLKNQKILKAKRNLKALLDSNDFQDLWKYSGPDPLGMNFHERRILLLHAIFSHFKNQNIPLSFTQNDCPTNMESFGVLYKACQNILLLETSISTFMIQRFESTINHLDPQYAKSIPALIFCIFQLQTPGVRVTEFLNKIDSLLGANKLQQSDINDVLLSFSVSKQEKLQSFKNEKLNKHLKALAHTKSQAIQTLRVWAIEQYMESQEIEEAYQLIQAMPSSEQGPSFQLLACLLLEQNQIEEAFAALELMTDATEQEMGLKEFARDCLHKFSADKVFEIAISLVSESVRTYMLKEVVDSFLKDREYVKAMDALSLIPLGSNEDRTFRIKQVKIIIAKLIQQEEFAELTKAINLMPDFCIDKYEDLEKLQKQMGSLVEHGQLDQAVALTNKFKDRSAYQLIRNCEQLIPALVNAGQAEKAMPLINLLSSYSRDKYRALAVEGLLKQPNPNIDQAIEFWKEVSDNNSKGFLLEKIIQALADKGEYDRAFKMMRFGSWQSCCDIILRKMIDKQSVLEVINWINSPAFEFEIKPFVNKDSLKQVLAFACLHKGKYPEAFVLALIINSSWGLSNRELTLNCLKSLCHTYGIAMSKEAEHWTKDSYRYERNQSDLERNHVAELTSSLLEYFVSHHLIDNVIQFMSEFNLPGHLSYINQIVEILLKQGKIEKAIEITFKMPSCDDKYRCFDRLVKTFIDQEELEKALNLRKLFNEEGQDWNYTYRPPVSFIGLSIVKVLLGKAFKTEEIDQVYKIAQEIPHQRLKEDGFILVAEAYAKSRNFAQAVSVVDPVSIQEESQRHEALKAIIPFFNDQNDGRNLFQRVIEMAQALSKEEYRKTPTLKLIGETAAKNGWMEEIRQILPGITGKYDKPEFLLSVIKALAEHKFFKDAWEMAQQIPDKNLYKRDEACLVIVQNLVANELTLDRIDWIVEIAQFIKKNDCSKKDAFETIIEDCLKAKEDEMVKKAKDVALTISELDSWRDDCLALIANAYADKNWIQETIEIIELMDDDSLPYEVKPKFKELIERNSCVTVREIVNQRPSSQMKTHMLKYIDKLAAQDSNE